MKLLVALALPTMILGLTALTVAPASAHTPIISADCHGVRVAADAYDADQANRWSVTIDGVIRSGTFGESLDQTFPVPRDGTTTSWSASVEGHDGSHRGESSGTVGPCGTAQPADVCAELPGDQPTGTPCTPQPPAVQTEISSTQLACDDQVQVTETVVTTTPFVYDEQTRTWVPGQPVAETTTQETPVSPQACEVEPGIEVAGVQASKLPQQAAPGTRAPRVRHVPSVIDAGRTPAEPTATAAPTVAGAVPRGALALLAGGGLLLAGGATRKRAA